MSFSKLYIDRTVVHSPQVLAIRKRLDVPVEVISEDRVLLDAISQGDDPIGNSKGILYLTRNKGAFVKKCPGTRDYTCCGYQILHIGTFCTMDCAYCILQTYFHPPVLRHYVNYEEMFLALDDVFSQETVSRIGTGEFTDSLIWEPWTNLSSLLVPAFGQQSRALLELKTKTTAIDALKDLHHNGKTILAWSLNTEAVIQHEERRTASLTARLRA
ncbi:MAG: DNA photolyase, partial [Desulfobacterales bacterium]